MYLCGAPRFEGVTNMETKHTPGPWHWSGDSLTHRQFDIYSPSQAPRQHVATVNNLPVERLWSRDASQALANAKLIAAAPDMLKALYRITHPAADESDLEFALQVIDQATGGGQ
jgi:hypothetical protein